MVAVLRLVAPNNREALDALSHVSDLAQQREANDLILYVRRPDGTDDVIFTGAFRHNKEKALIAALKLSTMLTRMQFDQP